jgi:hypothetical protein
MTRQTLEFENQRNFSNYEAPAWEFNIQEALASRFNGRNTIFIRKAGAFRIYDFQTGVWKPEAPDQKKIEII